MSGSPPAVVDPLRRELWAYADLIRAVEAEIPEAYRVLVFSDMLVRRNAVASEAAAAGYADKLVDSFKRLGMDRGAP